MQIVIDITEDIYKDIIENGFIYDEDNEVVADVIKNGTPLPKGHGDLKDADEIKKNQFTLGTSNYCEYKVVTIETIDKADTIIETDKENE